MSLIRVHDFKDTDLSGGTLVASIPLLGMGSILLTDYLLERSGMDHVASVDSPAFPPLAMVHTGKPRFPVRVHADAKSRLAVLRSEIALEPDLFHPLAQATVTWAKGRGMGRIIALDAAWTGREVHVRRAGSVLSISDDAAFAADARRAGLERFEGGAMGGLVARLLLEGRIQRFPVLALVAALRSPDDDLPSCRALAEALSGVVPGLRLDLKGLDAAVRGLENTLLAVRREAHEAIERMHKGTDGEAPPGQYV